MAALRSFLKVRDSAAEFVEVKAKGAVGIPCTVVGDNEKIILGTPNLADLR